ncbi:MAG TPA: hypothetical protein VFR05_00590 [Terriglobia bacterium]|nr:hypothetical protein [Terriglobia bacterium]
MNPAISITRIEIEIVPHRGSTLVVSLQNVGRQPVGPGSLVAKRISKDGSIEEAELLCPIGLAPGEKTRVRQLLGGSVKEIDFISYDPWDGAASVSILGLLSWWESPRSLNAA